MKVTSKGPANIPMIQTLRDPATPYLGALGMRKALGQRTRMVTVDTGNHGDVQGPGPALNLATGPVPPRRPVTGNRWTYVRVYVWGKEKK